MYPVEHIWTILMLKMLQAHLLPAFVANSKIDAIYALYLESFCDKILLSGKFSLFLTLVSPSPTCTSEKRKRRKEMIIWYGEVIPIYQLCLSQSTYGEGKNIQRSHKRHGNHRHPRDKVREIPQRETEIPSQSKSSDKEQMSSAHLGTASQSWNS